MAGSIFTQKSAYQPSCWSQDFGKLGPSSPLPWITPGQPIPLDTVLGQIAAAISAACSVSGTMAGSGAMLSAISCTATVTAALSAAGAFSSSITGTATVSATLDGAIDVPSASITAAAAVTASLLGAGALTSSISADVTVAADLLATATLSAALSASAALTGTLLGSNDLALSITATAAIVATLLGAGELTSSITTTATVVSTLLAAANLSAALTASVAITGTLLGAASLSASIAVQGIVVALGNLNAALQASVTASCTVTADLTFDLTLELESSDVSGVVTGGTPITLVGSGVLSSSLEDLTTWDVISAGDGTIVNDALVTSLTPDSRIGYRSASDYSYSDDEVVFDIGAKVFQGGTSRAVLGLLASDGSVIQLSVEFGRESGSEIRILVTGRSPIDYRAPARGDQFSLRIVRSLGNFTAFLSGSKIYSGRWLTAAAKSEIFVESEDSALLTATISRYTRLPVVTFGDAYATRVVYKSSQRMDVLAPASNVVGLVDVGLHGIYMDFNFPDSFTYEAAYTPLSRSLGSGRTFSAVSDKQVRA